MRTSIRRPVVLAATAVAALSLSLTACGGEDGAKSDGAAKPPSASKAADGGAGTSGSGTGGSDTAGSTAGGTEKAGSGTAGSGESGSGGVAAQAGSKKKPGAKAPACTADDVTVSAAKQEGVPTTHITLTAKNVSGRACTLLKYPLLAFGDLPQTSKDVPPVAKSNPGVPIVLEAGAPAYAAVRVNNGGVDDKNHAVTSFYVNFFATDGPAEGSKTVTAPKGGIAVDDAAAKTGYWTYELRNGADDF
ncbi:DUF4232 domain-containing protein [Streptomyces sp. NBC_00654]|uniref:DUF4232 domain-containing protein n=1 Tax=Streptomyces sp. NBC_00654 TaxID=2975799 RepID=UPI00224FC423|nr:DUF4232 domain-containing protein [Streptomyces sp. NBC_00654]MCX4965437.1 DUF4232 domain-containing protein [Streptomyces sp. NBC_00654]